VAIQAHRLALSLARAGRGIDVRLAEPVQARALRGRRRGAKTNRLDARWLALLLAREMLPESWIPALEDPVAARPDAPAPGDRRGSHALGAAAARLPQPRGLALLALASSEGHRPALGACPRPRAGGGPAERLLGLIEALDAQIAEVKRELRGIAREDPSARALQGLYGVGRTSPAHCWPRSARPDAFAALPRSSASRRPTRSRPTA
jgi:hypothetical protein